MLDSHVFSNLVAIFVGVGASEAVVADRTAVPVAVNIETTVTGHDLDRGDLGCVFVAMARLKDGCADVC